MCFSLWSKLRGYYGYPARCIRCNVFHPSTECTKLRDSPAKCALCSGDHRGCNVYRELHRRKTSNKKSPFLLDTIKSSSNNFNVKPSHSLPS